MHTHTDKTQENKIQSVSNENSQKQDDGASTFQVEDNRPIAIVQRKLQEMANNSPQVKQPAQLQTIANNHSAQQQQPIQKKENNTGLPDNLKLGIENLSGHSMNDVKVHFNSDKPTQLNAHAYAQGTNIHLASGQEKHLPHEAWHVVQQKQGRVKPTLQMKTSIAINDDPGLEKEADIMGAKAITQKSPVPSTINPIPSHNSMKLQQMTQRMQVIQLMRSTAQRQALTVAFLQGATHLKVGYITGATTRYTNARTEIGNTLAAGTMIIFDGFIRDNFSVGRASEEQDHVYGMVVSNAAAVPIVGQVNWHRGWFDYSKVDMDATRTAALALAAAAVVPAPIPALAVPPIIGPAPPPLPPVPVTPIVAVDNYLVGLAVAAPRSAITRAEMAPASIKAWSERTGTDLGTAMPMAGLGAVPAVALHGVDFGAALAADADRSEYTTVDPNNTLGLTRLDPAHPTFAAFSAFLNANAAAMPGTMAKKHELRDEGIGGPRALVGRQWLQQVGINDTPPGRFQRDRRHHTIAITGANVTNIFINSNAPTWAAYNANVVALQAQMAAQQVAAAAAPAPGVHVVPAPAPAFEPWQVLTAGPAAIPAFVQGFTHPRPGEEYLFHGTSHANVQNISRTGFNPEFVNYTFPKGYGKTGYGTAFTDQFAKALAYAPPEVVPQPHGAPSIYKHYVIVARVFIGNVYDADDRARRSRGNLEMTEGNLNYEESRGNKMKAQGKGKRMLLGKSSDTVRGRLDAGETLHSTYQHRDFDLTLDTPIGQADDQMQYRDTSLTVSDAIQMYPMFIIEATIPQANVRTGRR